MRASSLLFLLVGVVALGIIGCGGGGSSTPPPENTADIRGQVRTAGGAAGYEVLLDGQPVPGALRPDGSYVIEGVAPGEHRIAVIGEDGMTGGYCTVEVREGQVAEAPVIVPELGGQIVGMVTVRDEGGLRALPGVEVTAQPATIMPMPADVSGPELYPPPEPPDDLPTFSTFTDDHGSFLIGAVPEGQYVVTVIVPDMVGTWRWVWVNAGHTAVADFELRPAIEPGVGTVQGRVVGVRDGERVPLEGARVTIFSEEPWWPIGPIEMPAIDSRPAEEGVEEGDEGEPVAPDPDTICPPYFEGLSTLTDAQGRYVLNAPAGYASIEVWMPGYEPAWREIVIRAGQTLTASFALTPWGDDWPPPPGVPEPGPEPGEPPAPPDGGGSLSHRQS